MLTPMKPDGRERKPFAQIREAWQKRRGAMIVYLLLRAIVIAILVRSVMLGEYENVFTCALTLVLFLLPSFLERRMRIDLPDTMEIIILLFIFSTEILGEVNAWYVRVHGWDTIMHTLNGFLCAAIGFCIVGVLNRSSRVDMALSPAYLALAAFCFSMTIGVLWEFFEFGMDMFFHTDMQKDTVIHAIYSVALDPAGGNKVAAVTGIGDVIVNGEPLGLGGYLDVGIIDTMKDLFVNFIGAVVFSVIGYFYVKNAERHGFAGRFIPVVLPAEEPEGENTAELKDAAKKKKKETAAAGK